MEKIEIFDTTLRDGSQGEGIKFSANDKLRIAKKLDEFGVDYIEGGMPASNPKDMEFFEAASRHNFKNAKLVAFGMTRRKGVAVEQDEQMRMLLEAETPVITIVGKTWLLHVTEVLRATSDENLAMIADTVRFLKAHGKIVFYDAEHAFDGYRADPNYALATWEAAEKAGADAIVLCDTNGGCLPAEIARVTSFAHTSLKTRIGIHTHNDCELAVANALVAVESGATQVQGTINGFGERTGNCNLTSMLPVLHFKMNRLCVPPTSLPRLRNLSRFVDEVANVQPNRRQPLVGDSAFAHKGGMHGDAESKAPGSYQHMDPGAVGNRARMLVSDMSGRANILLKAMELGFKLTADTPELKTILARIKELENQGFEYEAAEGSLALLIQKTLRHSDAPFKVDAYHVSMRGDGKDSTCEATIKLCVGEKRAHTVAEGDGPVNALDSALRLALVKFYPELEKITLTDYKVRILDSTATGTAARTRVLIESSADEKSWGTVGVSENIIEASLQALTDSMEYAIAR